MSRFSDSLFYRLNQGCAAISFVILFVIAAVVMVEALPALRSIAWTRFWLDASWHPTSGQYNMLAMVVGTLVVSLGGTLLATPLGLALAIYNNFYAPAVARSWCRGMTAVLAGIPSVVYGLWGLVVLVPLLARVQPPGASIVSGSIIVAIMILPTVAMLSDSGLRQVPGSYLEGGNALSMSRFRVIFAIAVPVARSSIVTAVLLALARALGETMAVLMVTGNAIQMPSSIWDPVRSLAANIALEMAYAVDLHRASLFVSGLVLMALVAALIIAAEALRNDDE